MSTEIDRSRVLDFWRGRLEQHGYLVFQTTKIPLKDFRGLSIHHDSLPVVVLNGSDSNSGKVFTLFHEVAHLANRTSGLCSLVDGVDEEAVANAFAACFLMPEEQVTALLHVIDGTPEELAAEVAERFKVSRLAAGVRLRTLGVIDEDGLAAVRVQSDSIWEKHRKEQKKKGGGPPFWRVRYRDLGSAYIGAVARAVEDARVDWMDASYLLDARIPTVRQMFDEYYRLEGVAGEIHPRLVERGGACICEPVLRELKRGDDCLHAWAKDLPGFLCSTRQEEVQTVVEITRAHPEWVSEGRNEADPWVVAHGRQEGRVVVTEENMKGPNTADRNQKIPNIAREYGVETVKFFGFVKAQGWRF